MQFRLHTRVAFALVLLGTPLSEPAFAQNKARFITVEQGPSEFRADQILASELGDLVESPTRLAYEVVVRDMIDDVEAQGTVARMTPYAFVVAEMQGAKLDVIATYESKSTGRTMYNAYFVIPREEPLPASGGSSQEGDLDRPTLGSVFDKLADRSRTGDPVRFVYHTKLSTSSFFVPSLLFRSRRVFGQDSGGAGEGARIVVEEIDSNSSSTLVKMVADGAADLASVWDGTVRGFRGPEGEKFAEYGRKVWFLKLPNDLPCDMLVATKKVPSEIISGIKERLAESLPIEPTSADDTADWDVRSWVQWEDADAEVARSALSVLRHEASEPPSPIVVRVEPSGGAPVEEEELEAVRQAIRLSGTEFVAQEELDSFYRQIDVKFQLERIHDGAVRLTVTYRNFDLDKRAITQEFDISFVETADLTRRVGTLIHSRLHRIRPIWLYQDLRPTIIRDVDFEVSAGARLPMFEISWRDPARNDFSVARKGALTVASADFNTFGFEYDPAVFPPLADRSIPFQPMGRAEYRVLLMRTTPDRMIFRVLAVAVVALFVLALAGAIWDLRRSGTTGAHRSASRAHN